MQLSNSRPCYLLWIVYEVVIKAPYKNIAMQKFMSQNKTLISITRCVLRKEMTIYRNDSNFDAPHITE